MAFRWRAHDGSSLNAGLVALCFCKGYGSALQRDSISLYLGGGGVRTPCPPLDPRMAKIQTISAVTEIHNFKKWSTNPQKYKIDIPYLWCQYVSGQGYDTKGWSVMIGVCNINFLITSFIYHINNSNSLLLSFFRRF